MIIDCAIETDWWAPQDHLERIAIRAVKTAISNLDQTFSDETELSLLFADDALVQDLNFQWRQINRPTNVLSFAAREAGGPETPVLGDIVLARETIEREAAQQDKSRDDHLSHLIVHGFLHLIGFDHESDAEAADMESLETRILDDLGIADPYMSA
ncbi:MAG: rRNA maturation RNase YbeY [Rhizobiaceae bacterium]|nr:rRNA maturation RNase YbeY [Rhizobiaceae bacterium]